MKTRNVKPNKQANITKLVPVLMSNSNTVSLTSRKGTSLFAQNGVASYSTRSITRFNKLLSSFTMFFIAITRYQITTLSMGTKLFKGAATALNNNMLANYKTSFNSTLLPALSDLKALKSAAHALKPLLYLLNVSVVVFLENASLYKASSNIRSLGYFTVALVDISKPSKNIDMGLPCLGYNLHKQILFARVLLNLSSRVHSL
jgi:hypothetical protein